MKKILFAVIIILSLPVYAADTPLTLKNISGTEWEWHEGKTETWPVFNVKFTESGDLKVSWESYGFGEGITTFRGTYRVLDSSKIVLNYTKYSGYDKDNDKNFKEPVYEKKGRAVLLNDSVYSLMVIRFDGLILVGRDFPVKAGEKRTVNGIRVVTAGGVKGVVVKNAKIRKAPDASSDIVMFAPDLGEEGLSYCPAGKELKVLARTEEKSAVNKWNNYWYYVELISSGEFGERYGWIYGELLKLP